MGNTTFEVTYYSLYAFVLALRAHECAINNPALASVEMGQGAGGKPILVATYRRPANDEHGYEIGSEEWSMIFRAVDRGDNQLYENIPYELDRYIVNPALFDVVVTYTPEECDSYAPIEPNELSDMCEYIIECAIDNLPVAEYINENGMRCGWVLGKRRWRVGESIEPFEGI